MENTYEKILGKEASQFIPIINKILSEVKNHKWSRFHFEHKFGKDKIDAFLEKQRDKFSALLTFAFNPSILALKVINHIQLNELHVEPVNELNMDHIVAWQKCKQDIIQAGI